MNVLCGKRSESVITIARVHSRMYANRAELLENSLKFQFSFGEVLAGETEHTTTSFYAYSADLWQAEQ